MKKSSSSKPTSSNESFLTIQKQPTRTSTSNSRSWGKKNICSPLKKLFLWKTFASPLASQKLFQTVGTVGTSFVDSCLDSGLLDQHCLHPDVDPGSLPTGRGNW